MNNSYENQILEDGYGVCAYECRTTSCSTYYNGYGQLKSVDANGTEIRTGGRDLKL